VSLAPQIPNALTVLRIGLVPALAWALWERAYVEALALAAFMGLTDALDGYLAKHYGWRSRLGAMLDPLADKLMLMVTYVVLGVMGLVPVPLVVLVVLRDVVILGGAAAYRILIGPVEMQPTLISKLNTGMQIALVLLVVLDQLHTLPPVLIDSALWLTVLTTAWSGVDYVLRWSAKARAQAG
jgi:cardiolipin synthase